MVKFPCFTLVNAPLSVVPDVLDVHGIGRLRCDLSPAPFAQSYDCGSVMDYRYFGEGTSRVQ
ncbi:MAG: hypothetical protein LBI05_10380 [Planctomycetaceae bacterium]|nr:hypothetical protein [Planctomycetaceae bacterium]